MKDNEFLMTGYRINYKGIKQVLGSIFKLHNETINIWSHLLGVITFSALVYGIFTYYSVTVLPSIDTFNSVNLTKSLEEAKIHFSSWSADHAK
jgi:predicted membrane channel-forming protein YqfA (hemolysin III family)